MKKTNETFIEEMNRINPAITFLDEYKGRDNKISCKCKKCENIWLAMPRNLLHGTGCPNCAREKRGNRKESGWTTKTIKRQVAKSNPEVMVIGQYVKMSEKLKVKCRRCGYIWMIRPDHLLNGNGCPKCKGALKKDNKIFWKELEGVNSLIIPNGEYTNSKIKVQCVCKICGYEWSANPNKLLAGTGCPNCNNRNKTSFPEQAIFYYLRKVYPDAINRYKIENTKCELDIYIPSIAIGIEYDGVHWHTKEKRELEKEKYQLCKEKKITLYRIREEKENNSFDADMVFYRETPYKYPTLDKVIQQILAELKIELEVNTQADAIKIKEQFYRKIKNNSLKSKYPIIAQEWNYDKNGDLTPEMLSYASNDKVWWKCRKCKREWLAAVCDRTVAGKGCKVCKDNEAGKKRRISNEEFVKRLSIINPDMIPLEEYKTTHEKIKTQCRKCGHIWYPMPSNSLRGKKCPKCVKNKNS